MAPELRPHQTKMVAGLDEAVAAGHRCVVLQAPTASGKGTIAAHLAVREAARDPEPGCVVVVSHLGEINRDLRARLLAAGCPSVRHIGDSDEGPTDAPVVVISSQALDRSDRVFPNCRLLIRDEGHRAGSASDERFIAAHLALSAVVVLPTATPARSDGRMLAHATHIVRGPQIGELLDLDLLAPITVIAPAAFEGYLAADPASIYPADRRGIVYASSVPHSLSIMQGLRARGIAAQHLDGTIHPTTRRRIFEAFASGATQVLCNFSLVAEGVDVPDAEVCMLAGATTSAVAYLQKIGRVRRHRPGKRAILYDFRGSMHLPQNGHPDEDRYYSLTGQVIQRVGDDAQKPVMCACGAWGFPRSSCEVCGGTRPAAPLPRVRAKDMIEHNARRPEEAQRAIFRGMVEKLFALGKRGKSLFAAEHQFAGFVGSKPPRAWILAEIDRLSKEAAA